MDEMNVMPTDGIMTTPGVLPELPPITEKTTLREVLDMLQPGEPPALLPSANSLREDGGDPLVEVQNCRLYRSGLAIYHNKSGESVVWLPNCTKFTYHFNKLRDSEKDTLKEKKSLPDGLLEGLPWVIAVTLIGDHRVEANVMNRKGSRKGTVLVYIFILYSFYVANVANGYINITIKKNIGKVMKWNATSATEIGKMK